MGEHITLQAGDGHRFGAWAAGDPASPRRLVVVQEIFGVNRHMRAVTDTFASQGYRAIAPALFDRAERDVELAYDRESARRGMALRAAIPEAAVLADIEAAATALEGGPTGIVGYCWGGTIAWWGATRTTRFAAAVGWYGGGIAASREATPHCPVQLHFGEADAGIPATDIAAIQAAQPDVEIFVYPGAGHGFGATERDSFDPEATRSAQERTLAFFARHLG
jgi:carboxymethylenebutenolidase